MIFIVMIKVTLRDSISLKNDIRKKPKSFFFFFFWGPLDLRLCDFLVSLFWIFSLVDHLIADEFSSELADGVAYVAGHDEESRPVLVSTNDPS